MNSTNSYPTCLAHLFAAFALIACAVQVQAKCTDAEYRIYTQYDSYLDSNPSIPDDQLRYMFSRKIGMKPNALKNLYIRCTMRWAESNPKSASAYVDKGLKEFSDDCFKRPGDKYCKAVIGK